MMELRNDIPWKWLVYDITRLSLVQLATHACMSFMNPSTYGIRVGVFVQTLLFMILGVAVFWIFVYPALADVWTCSPPTSPTLVPHPVVNILEPLPELAPAELDTCANTSAIADAGDVATTDVPEAVVDHNQEDEDAVETPANLEIADEQQMESMLMQSVEDGEDTP